MGQNSLRGVVFTVASARLDQLSREATPVVWSNSNSETGDASALISRRPAWVGSGQTQVLDEEKILTSFITLSLLSTPFTPAACVTTSTMA